MKVYQGNGLGDMYYQLVRDITEHGRKVVVRGQKCIEMPEPVTLVYEKPGYCWMNIPGRKFNPFFALAEVPWILSGNGNVEWISQFNSNMRQFSDGGENFHGSYGLRLRKWERPYEGNHWVEPVDQIKEVVRKFREDPFTRQGVMCLWDPVRDNVIKSKDIPCNNLVYYNATSGALDQTVVIRSNDLVWGTPHNAVQFSHLHALVAGELGADMGKLTYVIQNLHYYYDLYPPTLANILEKAYESEIKALNIPGFSTVTDSEISELSARVEAMLASFRLDVVPQEPMFGAGYWNQILPKMIYIYSLLKGSQRFEISIYQVAERILMLGSPLVELILDFYEGTENEIAHAVMAECRTALTSR